jgi:hypothetical protein
MLYVIQDGNILNNQVVDPHVLQHSPQLYRVDPKGTLTLHDKKEIIRVAPVDNVLMIDLDAPYPDNPNKSPLLHWLKLNSVDVVSFMGPQPPRDSNPHRYQFLALDAQREITWDELHQVHMYESDRTLFPLALFLREFRLEMVASSVVWSGFPDELR